MNGVAEPLFGIDEQGLSRDVLALPLWTVQIARLRVGNIPAPAILVEAARQIAAQQKGQRPVPLQFRRLVPHRLGAVEAFDRAVEIAQIAQHESQIVDERPDRRIAFDGGKMTVPRLVEASHRPQRIAEVGPRTGVFRLQRHAPLQTGDTGLEPAQAAQGDPAIDPGRREARVRLQDSLINPDSLGAVAGLLLLYRHAERGLAIYLSRRRVFRFVAHAGQTKSDRAVLEFG